MQTLKIKMQRSDLPIHLFCLGVFKNPCTLSLTVRRVIKRAAARYVTLVILYFNIHYKSQSFLNSDNLSLENGDLLKIVHGFSFLPFSAVGGLR